MSVNDIFLDDEGIEGNKVKLATVNTEVDTNNA